MDLVKVVVDVRPSKAWPVNPLFKDFDPSQQVATNPAGVAVPQRLIEASLDLYRVTRISFRNQLMKQGHIFLISAAAVSTPP